MKYVTMTKMKPFFKHRHKSQNHSWKKPLQNTLHKKFKYRPLLTWIEQRPPKTKESLGYSLAHSKLTSVWSQVVRV